MRVTIDLMKNSTQIIDLSNVINPRVGDDDLLLPLHICYGDNLYDMRGKDVEFLSQDANNQNIYVAGTCSTDTPGDNLYMGDLTFRFPAGTFQADGTYDPDQTMFRIVDKATQKVISSVNVKITVMKNTIEFNFDPDKSSYDSRAETMLQDFHDKGQAMLDEIKDLNNQANSNVSGDTAATANAAKQQANQNAGDISDLKGEVAGARGRFADLPGREDAQDTAISQKETIVNANANYAALQQKDAQQDVALNQKAGKFELEDKLSQMDLQPEGFENEAALKAKYPNGKSGIMVTVDTGHKFIWANGSWTDAGIYQSVGLADGSVTGTKLDPKIRGLGANIGIPYPTKIQRLEPNAFKPEDSKPLPIHFKYLVDIKIYNPDPAKTYFMIRLSNGDDSKYGALVGSLPKTNGIAISTVGAEPIGTSTDLSSTPLAENQDGFVTDVINDGPTRIYVTYDQRQMTQDNCNICHFMDPGSGDWYDCCLIDDACYVGNGFIRPFSQLYHQRIEPNGNDTQRSITPARYGYLFKKILVINPDPNKLYFVGQLGMGSDGTRYATFGTFDKPDNNDVASVNTSTAKLLTQTQPLPDKPVVSSDGLITQSFTYNNHTTIIITYDTTKLYPEGGVCLADPGNGNYYDNCIIDSINYINLPTVGLAGDVKFNKPAWLGDSITESNNIAHIHYHDILSANWKSVRSDNLGINGSTVGNKFDPMSERYVNIPADADFISVFGGINDYGRDQPLGAYGDVTNDTFYGALRVLCEGLQTKFPQVPKIYVSPIHIGSNGGGSFNAVKNGLGFTQKQYEDAIDLITADYGIPHLSLYHNSGITFAIKAQADIYSADTLHPNDTGQTLIAQKIQQFVNYNFA